jgi:hypothetical protein
MPLLLGAFIDSRALRGAIMGLDNVVAIMLIPVVGAWSDRVDGRWGRRLPFLLVGVPITALAFAALPWAAAALWTLLLVDVVFLLAITVYRAPLVALMPDHVARGGAAQRERRDHAHGRDRRSVLAARDRAHLRPRVVAALRARRRRWPSPRWSCWSSRRSAPAARLHGHGPGRRAAAERPPARPPQAHGSRAPGRSGCSPASSPASSASPPSRRSSASSPPRRSA